MYLLRLWMCCCKCLVHWSRSSLVSARSTTTSSLPPLSFTISNSNFDDFFVLITVFCKNTLPSIPITFIKVHSICIVLKDVVWWQNPTLHQSIRPLHQSKFEIFQCPVTSWCIRWGFYINNRDTIIWTARNETTMYAQILISKTWNIGYIKKTLIISDNLA